MNQIKSTLIIVNCSIREYLNPKLLTAIKKLKLSSPIELIAYVIPGYNSPLHIDLLGGKCKRQHEEIKEKIVSLLTSFNYSIVENDIFS